jgi:hypothetical protein
VNFLAQPHAANADMGCEGVFNGAATMTELRPTKSEFHP